MRAKQSYTADQVQLAAQGMIKYGGSFSQHLGEALLRADRENTEKILTNWEDDIEKHLKFMTPKYDQDDVLRVAYDLGIHVTEEEVQKVLSKIEEESANDPSGNLSLWIENILYNIKTK